MTFFLEIVKVLLPIDIRSISKASITADNSTGNSITSMFGYGRDLELSEKKREFLEDLLLNIRSLTDVKLNVDSVETDAATYGRIKEYIELCRKKAATESKKKSYTEGTFGPAMQNLGSFLDDIYKKLQEVNLLNIPHDDNPFNIFRYHMAVYFASKVDEARTPGLLDTIAHNPKVSSLPELTESKEVSVLKAIAQCAMDLEDLDVKREGYHKACAKIVKASVETLRRRNEELCMNHSAGISIPIAVTFFSSVSVDTPKMGPKAGTLEDCLAAALEEITPTVAQEAEKAFDLH